MQEELDIDRVEKMAFVLKTIAHPMRVGIIDLLSQNEKMSVNDITAYLGLEQSLTSHHLANLKMKGVLGSKREGKNIFYFPTVAFGIHSRCHVGVGNVRTILRSDQRLYSFVCLAFTRSLFDFEVTEEFA